MALTAACVPRTDHRTSRIEVSQDLSWRELIPLLDQCASDGSCEIRINGGPFYLPCYSPYDSGAHPRQGPIKQPPMLVGPNTPLSEFQAWIETFALKGALVYVAADAPARRVTELAKILDAHKITASWSRDFPRDCEFKVYETAVFAVPEETSEMPNHVLEGTAR